MVLILEFSRLIMSLLSLFQKHQLPGKHNIWFYHNISFYYVILIYEEALYCMELFLAQNISIELVSLYIHLITTTKFK